jgi:hypothetical protein
MVPESVTKYLIHLMRFSYIRNSVPSTSWEELSFLNIGFYYCYSLEKPIKRMCMNLMRRIHLVTILKWLKMSTI